MAYQVTLFNFEVGLAASTHLLFKGTGDSFEFFEVDLVASKPGHQKQGS